MGNFIDRTGLKYGKWTVIRLSHTNECGAHWHCRCDCGTESVVFGGNLGAGKTTSCGCVIKTQGGMRRGSDKLTRGTAAMRWKGMMDRCYLESASNYYNYGARGIKVCERWHYLPNFIADMGEPPTPEHSLDRINPDADYYLENCRWATAKEQGRNRRNNRLFTFNGKTQCASAWIEELGIPSTTFWNRIRRGNYAGIFKEVQPTPPLVAHT